MPPNIIIPVPRQLGARVYNDAAINVDHNSLTLLTYNTERFDFGSIHSPGTNPDRLTVPRAGKYVITLHVQFAAFNDEGYRQVTIWLNGATPIAAQTIPNAGSNVLCNISLVTIYDLAATEYVSSTAYQNSGGALNVNVAANISPEFSIWRIGS